jgi:hypothetical protein
MLLKGEVYMAIITRDSLRNKAKEKGFTKYASTQKLSQKSLEFTSEKTYDIFLSHSYLDADEIDALYEDIIDMGFSVYIDWKEDRDLDRSNVTKETANLLRQRMNNCKSLLFVTTSNSTNSKWCPWELGYFDGKKGMSAIFPVLDISTTTDIYTGTEYLGIYPYITKDTIQGTTKQTLWVNNDVTTYVLFENWLRGSKPSKH